LKFWNLKKFVVFGYEFFIKKSLFFLLLLFFGFWVGGEGEEGGELGP
jgi:hypothetical protein